MTTKKAILELAKVLRAINRRARDFSREADEITNALIEELELELEAETEIKPAHVAEQFPLPATACGGSVGKPT